MARISYIDQNQQEALDSDEACCDYLKSKTLAKHSVKAVTFLSSPFFSLSHSFLISHFSHGLHLDFGFSRIRSTT